MSHLGSKTSKESRALANIRLQLKTGKTRGKNPRELPTEEITALESRRDALTEQMKQKARERTVARINAHTREREQQRTDAKAERERVKTEAADERSDKKHRTDLALARLQVQTRCRGRCSTAF